jgi:hypothetical protein
MEPGKGEPPLASRLPPATYRLRSLTPIAPSNHRTIARSHPLDRSGARRKRESRKRTRGRRTPNLPSAQQSGARLGLDSTLYVHIIAAWPFTVASPRLEEASAS